MGIFKLYKFIEDAHTHTNRAFLHLLLQDQQLIPRLRSLERYFFLAFPSFLTHLLDLAHTELKKPAKGVNIVKLQSLLNLTLTGKDAAFREDVISVNGVIGGEEGEGVLDEEAKKDRDREKDDKPMLAIDALTLDYNVKLPLSLVIFRKMILHYQLLFRFLLHLKHVEQSLASMWILAFTTFEVFEPNWRAQEANLAKANHRRPASEGSHGLSGHLPERMHVDECQTAEVTYSTFALYTSPVTKSANQALATAESDGSDQAVNKSREFLKKFESNFNHR
ncbi:Spc98 family-domain-containing protein [Suillus subaureus]|uniref:Spindle pole body component n=1 Tax=Suillus subaureus TaxID=48587 RepID=A0A9P7E540_9AGAM|nr:Spc98 family-domain-containing protein [Suillus subaureus]KAG1810709.1 Spc98 family-domain-containing protein [Suillus subaureus]